MKDYFWFKLALTLAQNPFEQQQTHKNGTHKAQNYCHMARERPPGRRSYKNRIQSKILSQNKS